MFPLQGDEDGGENGADKTHDLGDLELCAIEEV